MMELTRPVLDQRDGQGGVGVAMATGGLSSPAPDMRPLLRGGKVSAAQASWPCQQKGLARKSEIHFTGSKELSFFFFFPIFG